MHVHSYVHEANMFFHYSQVVLVGDPQQLPATVTSDAAQRARYDRSMLSRYVYAQARDVQHENLQYSFLF